MMKQAFIAGLAKADLRDDPDVFICHDYRHKPLFIYGYMRDHGNGAGGRHEVISGDFHIFSKRAVEFVAASRQMWLRLGRKRLAASGLERSLLRPL